MTHTRDKDALRPAGGLRLLTGSALQILRLAQTLLQGRALWRKGCWDFFDNDARARSDFNMWVSGMLTELGYNVTRVDCAAGAVAALEANPAFDIVFSDLVMPGEMDGIALAREIGRLWPSLPVLLTTGFSPGVAAAAEEGLTLLTKPYGIGALAAALDGARPG